MRIVHLSDIHLSNDNIIDFRNFFLRALTKDLKQKNEEKPIDIIILTGDLIDKGGASFSKGNPYTTFEKEFIEPIKTALQIHKHKIIFLPGNHDIDQKSIDRIVENGLQKELNSIENINKFISNHGKKGHAAINRNQKFKSFEGKYFKELKNKQISNFESCFIYDIGGKTVGFAGFNSAWRCSGKENDGSLIFGTQQIQNANEFFKKNNCDFVVGLIHHPIEQFANIERQEIYTMFQNLNFDLLLMGHIHKGSSQQMIGNQGTLFTSISRSCFNNPREKIDQYKSGYAIYDVDLNTLQLDAEYRKYYHKRIEFAVDLDESKDGKAHFELIPPAKKAPIIQLSKLNNRSLSVYKTELDSSLIISHTNTIAPKELSRLFVLPKLSEEFFKYDEERIVPPKYLALQEILIRNDNILFFGAKEIGKTTLLNKLFFELAENFPKYQVIPVKVDFKDLINKKLKNLVCSFLHEPASDVENLLKNEKIVLLIDNLEDTEDRKYSKTSLREFLEEYQNVRIIGTTSERFELVVTREKSFFELTHFTPIYISNVTGKEFKDLAQKWFANKRPEWFTENLEKLIRVFEIMRIPRTFFSVSLFLWIIEKNENYTPTNRATLVEQFITSILEGFSTANADAGVYNFIRKKELLQEIALCMFSSGTQNDEYSLDESEILKVIETNFNLNQRKWLVSDKLEEFLSRGILKRDGNSNKIKFRYKCFFEYFLSFSIETNESFKEFVFSDDNFLSFIEEIDYFTARNQSDIQTLKWVFEKLDESFKGLDKIINDNINDYIPDVPILLREVKAKEIIPSIKENKLSNEQVEKYMNDQLDSLPVDDSISSKPKVDRHSNFPSVLELAARILKNSENVKNPELVNRYLDVLVLKTAKYSIFLQAYTTKMCSERITQLNTDEEKRIITIILLTLPIFPLIVQSQLLGWVGTEFLNHPLDKKLERLEKTGVGVLSELELFLTLFTYTDLRLPGSIKKILRAIKLIRNRYISELFFWKVFIYYMLKSENSQDLPQLERIMNVLLAKAQRISKKKAKVIVDSSFHLEDDGDE